MMAEIAKKLDVKYKIIPVPDGSSGKPLANGSWTGMIGMLIANVSVLVQPI